MVPATVLAWCLVAANVGLWIALEILGGGESRRAMVTLGAKVNSLIDRGEYWRLLTAVFLHFSLTHLVFNAVAIMSFGRLAEVVYGHTRFLAIYLLSGIAGTTASYAFTRGPSAGASGALFGIGAALVVFYARNRRLAGSSGRSQLMGYAFLLGVNVLFGFVQPGIDNWGHLGGLAMGLILGFFLTPRLVARPEPDLEAARIEVRASPVAAWFSVPAALVAIAIAVLAIQAGRQGRPPVGWPQPPFISSPLASNGSRAGDYNQATHL